MQSSSFKEHYYKIKSATFSVLLHAGRKPVCNIRHKTGCTVNEDGLRLEFSVVRKKRDCAIHVTKTKIRCFVTAQLICTFDFAKMKNMFSHVAAQIMDAFFFFII